MIETEVQALKELVEGKHISGSERLNENENNIEKNMTMI